MTSERKGSNPGGKCIAQSQGTSIESYIKYCDKSRLHPHNPFNPNHQPVYEALTLKLAQSLGLRIPNYHILTCDESSFDQKNIGHHKVSETKPLYFLSQLTNVKYQKDLTPEEKAILPKLMFQERMYRDLLMIGDVSHKPQNYGLIQGADGPQVMYIDVGCSFVDSVNGELSQRNAVSKLLGSRNYKGTIDNGTKKKIRHAQKHLSRHMLVTSTQEDILSLDELVQGVGNLELPKFPHGGLKISQLLSSEELEEIQSLLYLNMAKILRSYEKKEDARILRI